MANSSQNNSRSYNGSRKISNKSKNKRTKRVIKKNKKNSNLDSDTDLMLEILSSPAPMQVTQVPLNNLQTQQVQQMQGQLSPSQFDPLMLYDAVPFQKISYENNQAFANAEPKGNVGMYMKNLSNLSGLSNNVSLPVNTLQAQPMQQMQQMQQMNVQPVQSVPVQQGPLSQQQLVSNLNNLVQLGGKM